MKREDFMAQLSTLLQSISPQEREEALQYYNDYFDDAGVENEQEVIEALGNPAKVAENIKRDLYGEGAGIKQETVDNPVVKYKEAEYKEPEKEKSSLPTWAIVMIVIACVIMSPAILGAATGVAGALFGLICAWFGIILGFGIGGIAFIVVMFVLIVIGGMCLFASPMAALALFGAGLLCGGIGLLLLIITVAMAGVATPAIIKGIWKLFRGKKSV